MYDTVHGDPRNRGITAYQGPILRQSKYKNIFGQLHMMDGSWAQLLPACTVPLAPWRLVC